MNCTLPRHSEFASRSPQSSPGLTCRSRIPRWSCVNREAAAYWMPASAGMTLNMPRQYPTNDITFPRRDQRPSDALGYPHQDRGRGKCRALAVFLVCLWFFVLVVGFFGSVVFFWFSL